MDDCIGFARLGPALPRHAGTLPRRGRRASAAAGGSALPRPRNDLPEEYDTKAVAALLNTAKGELLCVRGNCDAEVDQMMLEFPIMADYCVLDWDGRTVFATHGHLLTRSICLRWGRGTCCYMGTPCAVA
jgi:hypothetical protein